MMSTATVNLLTKCCLRKPGHHGSLCAIIDYKTKMWKAMRSQVRHASGWKKRLEQIDERKRVVYQYADKNSKRSDRIYTWGYAATGALGVSTFLDPSTGFSPRRVQNYPFRFKFFDDNQLQVYDIACGYGYTVYACKSQDGEHLLYGTGINTDSQIGYHQDPPGSGTVLDYLIQPVLIPLPGQTSRRVRIAHLACGRAHTVVVTENGEVYSLGNNAAGQCGRNIIDEEIYSGSQLINKVKFNKPIKQVVCGQDHTLFLTTDGEVYSCGLGADGQTGQGDYESSGDLQQVKGEIDAENITHLSSKADCVLAVSENGEVFGWGNSEYNQLSVVAGEETQVCEPRHLPFEDVGKVTATAAAGSMCCLINDTGGVFVWGYGLLGKGPKLESSRVPSEVPRAVLGRNQFNPNSLVVDVQCGMSFFAALTNNGDLYTWGRNKSGVLGLCNDLDQFFPFKVSVPAEVKKVHCGVDHMYVTSKTYA